MKNKLNITMSTASQSLATSILAVQEGLKDAQLSPKERNDVNYFIQCVQECFKMQKEETIKSLQSIRDGIDDDRFTTENIQTLINKLSK